jgi:hypothetical protein
MNEFVLSTWGKQRSVREIEFVDKLVTNSLCFTIQNRYSHMKVIEI